ncbi:MAG: DNA polymerase III subunit beta [Deltaproteobacteria bacterium]|nr:DNA polymerase III subunit beta [Deltaproteobacteria bacterium]
MESILEKEDLLHCLYLVQGVVEKRSSLPILSHVLIESKDGAISLRATDLEIGLRQQCRATVKKEGAVTTDARKLYEIVRELSPDRVSLRSTGNGWVEVSSGKSRFRMASLDPKEFPALVSTPAADVEGKKPLVSVAIAGQTLREMIEKTLFAASPDESRPNLSGVYLEGRTAPKGQENGRLRMVASDGHRLSFIEREAFGTVPIDWPSAILPRKGLVEARKLLEKGDEKTELVLHGSTLNVARDSTELSMRLVEGDFPDYNQVIPIDTKHVVSFSREDLLSALRRLLILTTERSRGVKIQIEKDKMEISVNTPDLGEGVEEIAIDYAGENLVVGFNGRYLIEMLSVLEGEQKISFLLKDESSPCLIQAEKDQNFSYVVMPMRIF